MTFSERIAFESLMEPVALRLLGEPNKALSKYPTDMRWGTNGSLSVNYETGQFYDHEADLGGGVIDFLQHKGGHDRDGAIAWLRREGLLRAAHTAPPKATFECAYDYTDESGELLFQVLRYVNPKTFKQRRPGAKHGEWDWKLGDVRRVLYRLPQLIAATQKRTPVFLVEGEKDSDSLAELGFTATTNPGGANKWRDEYTEVFRRASVIVIPDHDDAGREHVDKIITSLHGVAERIRVLDLRSAWPECPDKGDISDWLANGGTKQKLIELVKALPDWQPPAEPQTSNASEVTPLDRWPTIDEAAFHGLAGDFVRTFDPHTEADLVGLLIQLLVAFGSVVGSAPYYLVEADKHHCNLFAVLVGNSSKGRKGTGGGRVRAITQAADAIWFSERTASGLSTGEGLIEHVRDEVIKWNAKEQKNEIVDPGVKDKRLMVTESEFAGTLAVMERPGNTLSPVVRNAWDGLKLQTITRASPLKATGAHISIVAHITQDEIRARLSRTDMANGFANRFLFCLTRRSKLLPHGGHADQQAMAELGETLKDAFAFAQTVGRVSMTDRASDAWVAVYPELSAERAGLLGAVTARAEAQTIRLALVYALLDRQDTIDLAHLNAALAVWGYCDQSAALIFGDSLGEQVADDILVALRHSPAGMTRTEIHNLSGRHRTSDQTSAALALLLKLGRVRFETRQTGGRPVETWFAIGGSPR